MKYDICEEPGAVSFGNELSMLCSSEKVIGGVTIMLLVAAGKVLVGRRVRSWSRHKYWHIV
jgi:hypothetical protein